MNEQYYMLVGRTLGKFWYGIATDHRSGTPVRVLFNYQRVYDQELAYGDVIGFFHTHPNMISNMSDTDYATMCGWTNALGKRLMCVIEGKDGMSNHVFDYREENEHVDTFPVYRVGNIFFGRCYT